MRGFLAFAAIAGVILGSLCGMWCPVRMFGVDLARLALAVRTLP